MILILKTFNCIGMFEVNAYRKPMKIICSILAIGQATKSCKGHCYLLQMRVTSELIFSFLHYRDNVGIFYYTQQY